MTTGQVQSLESMNTKTVPKQTYYFDLDGDRTIPVGPQGLERFFVVSSPAMSLACKHWKTMFGVNSAYLEGPNQAKTLTLLRR